MPRRTSVPKRQYAQASVPRPDRALRTPPVVTAPPRPDRGPCVRPGCGEVELFHLKRDDGASPCGRMWCGCRAYLPPGVDRG